MAGYAILRAADAPDHDDGDAEAAFLLVSVRVGDDAAESLAHDGYWPRD